MLLPGLDGFYDWVDAWHVISGLFPWKSRPAQWAEKSQFDVTQENTPTGIDQIFARSCVF